MVRGAAHLLRERGYSGTGFREVIALTGAPRGSIYHHFPGGKAELAGEAVDYVGGLAAARSRARFAEGDPIAALRSFVALWRADFERSGGRAGCPILAVAVENHDDAPELPAAADRASASGRTRSRIAPARRGRGASGAVRLARGRRGGRRDRPEPRAP